MPKSVPKSIQTCFGANFSKLFLLSVPWRVKFSKNLKNFFSKFQKCPKSFPKVSKRVLNMFCGKSFGKFLPSFRWNVESPKMFKNFFFKIPKMPKSVPKRIQTCFRVIFSKKFNAQCSMEGRVFENFQKKIRKVSKFQKCPKSFLKVSKRVLNVFCGKSFGKFLPSFRWNVESSKIFKFFFFFKIPKMPKSVPKRIQTCFRVIFFEKI